MAGTTHSRTPAITLNEAAVAAGAVLGLGGPDRPLAAETMRQLASSYGHASLAALLDPNGERRAGRDRAAVRGMREGLTSREMVSGGRRTGSTTDRRRSSSGVP
jgi:hypothetical protein